MIKLLAGIFIKNSTNYDDPGVRTAYGILTGVVGIVLNFLLFAGKLAAGLISSSVSVAADAFNNLSDAGSSVISIAGYRIAAMPADKEHPFGHGRAEYIAGLIVSGTIVFMAFEIGRESLSKIFQPDELSADPLTLCILAVSILVKLYIFAYNHTVGKKINSAPMKAVAVDSISDCAATLTAAAALVVYALWNVNIDGYVGLLIALVILKAGIEAARESLTPLLGQKAEDSYIAGIRETVENHDGILGIHDLYVHNYGVGRNVVSLHAEIPAFLSFKEAHEIADSLEREIGTRFGAIVTVHMDPADEDDEFSAGCRSLISSVMSEISPEAAIHDFRMYERGGRQTVEFDAEVPFGLPMSDEEIKNRLTAALREYDDRLEAVICIDKKIY